MKVLVTGGAGFISQSLIAALPAAYEVVVVDSLAPEAHDGATDIPAALSARARCICADVADVDAWSAAAAGVDVVVHLAALTGTGQSDRQAPRYLAHNVTATARLCDALAGLSRPPHRVILASSRAVYGEGAYADGDRLIFPGARRDEDLAAGQWELTVDGRSLRPVATAEDAPVAPVSVYALTKLLQERLVRACAERLGIDSVMLRLQNVYGPLQGGANPHAGIVAALARGIVQENRVELFEDGDMTRDFIHIDDVVGVFRAAIDRQTTIAQTLNVGTGRRTSLRQLVALLSELAAAPAVVSCHGRFRGGDVRHAAADMGRLAQFAGEWQPRDLAAGLTGYVGWLAQHLEARSCP